MHRARSTLITCLIASAVCASHSSACIWDNDTLRDEMRGLPGVAEVLAGKFEKRSEYFYRDRVSRTERWLVDHLEDQNAIDNLAVALFRIGEFDRAVEVLRDKEKRFPDQYTTASNLATFQMLRGESASAISLLEKALRINPDAHFGREEYQLKLARFLVANTTQPADMRVRDFLGQSAFGDATRRPSTNPIDSEDYEPTGRGFKGGVNLSEANREKAIAAIVGMIRFGTEESPDLYYALGNLLAQRGEDRGFNVGDKHLAIRAYLRAIELKHPQAEKIRRLAEVLSQQIEGEEDLELHVAEFAKERVAGQAWAQAYMDFADQLIRDGKDPDLEANYAPFYEKHGVAVVPNLGAVPSLDLGTWLIIAAFGGAVLIAVAKRIKRRPKLSVHNAK